MKYLLHTFYLLTTLFFITSCGVDRSGEYYALVGDDMWIEEVMKQHYLWYDQIPEISEKDYFAEPEEFLQKLLYSKALDGKGDPFSYVEMKANVSRSFLNQTSTYGFDFELVTDPLGTTSHTYARVLFVLPDSPASEAGLQRGDWISAVGDAQINVNNYGYLISGDATTLTRKSIIAGEDDYIWTDVDVLSIGASRPVEINPFYINKVFNVNGKKIAYMVYNKFSTGPLDNGYETDYAQQMLQIFSEFKSEAPDAFILDLRYNPGGYLTCAQELASLLAPESALGKPFCTMQYNDITTPQDTTYNFISTTSAQNLNLNKLYVITSTFTASASEAVINCLRPYMGDDNVVVIGETTVGKPVAMSGYTNDEIDFILWPVVAYVLNADGKADYVNGITPDYKLNERGLISPLLPLGDENELMLKNTLSLITTGTMPDAEKPEETETQSAKELYNSLSRKKINGVLLR